MRNLDEQALAATVQETRTQQGLSQSALAEAAGVSTKTIQRVEAGKSIALSSRRAILTTLHIDPLDLKLEESTAEERTEGPWVAVHDAHSLLKSLAAARRIDVQLDRAGWQKALRERPWYRQKLVFTAKDPIDVILEFVDRAAEFSKLPPGLAAKEQDDLAEALKVAGILDWALATHSAPERLSLYIGSPQTVTERTAQTSASSSPRM